MVLGLVETRKPFHAFRRELPVGDDDDDDDDVFFADGCNENVNHCSLRLTSR